MKSFLEESISKIISNNTSLSDLVIVLPSIRAGVFFKEALTKQLSKPTLSPKIFSIEEFIQELSTLKIVPKTTALVDFYQIYFSNTPKKYLDTFEEFIKWAPALLKDFSDLDAYLVDVNIAFENLSSYHAIDSLLGQDDSYEKQQNFWKSLIDYYNNHKNALEVKGLGSLGMLYREAVNSVDIYLQNTNNRHYFIGFNALNTAESTLFQAFLELNRAQIFWDIDQYFYQDTNHAAGRFIKRYLKEWNFYRKSDKMKFPSNFEEIKDIRIVGIPKSIGQAKYAASILKNSLKSSNSLKKTALILGNESILIPVLSGLPEEINQWNVTMGYSLLNTPVALFFNHFFELHLRATSTGFQYVNFLRVISFDWIQEVLNLNSKKGSDFLMRLSRTNKTFLDIKELSYLLRHPIGSLIFNPFKSVESFIQRILDITIASQEHLKVKLAPEYLLYPTYLTLIQELIQQLFNMGETLSIINSMRGIHYLWNELIQTLTIDYKGNPMGSFQIMGMLETRVLDFDTVILTNLNEGILPKGRSSQSVFPFAIKRAMGLPTFLDNDAIYTYHFYRLLQRAKNITLIYNSESDGLNSGEPSRFIHQLRFLGLKQHRITEHFESAITNNIPSKKVKVYKTTEVIDILSKKAKKGFSASYLGAYLVDPLKFYNEKILKINQSKTLDNSINSIDLGIIAHNALNELYEPYLKRPLKEAYFIAMIKEVNDTLLKHYRIVFGGDEFVLGKSKLMLFALEKSIIKMLQIERELILKGNTITIIKLEEEFNSYLEVDGVGEIALTGIIDRVDLYNGVLRIIDYKSGKIEPAKLKISDWNCFKGDEKRRALFQILFYSHLNEDFLKTEQELIAGIISFKSMDSYLLPIGLKNLDGKKNIQKVNKDTISSFKNFLIELIQEIFDVSKPFASLEE